MKIISKYKSHILVFIISGILFSSVGAYAALIISSNEVAVNSSHTNKTNVADSLDEIYTAIDDGKSNIINSLNSKGLELTSNATYSQIVNGINSIPIGKNTDDEWSLKDNNGNFIPRNSTDVYISRMRYSSGTVYLAPENNKYGVEYHNLYINTSKSVWAAIGIYLNDDSNMSLTNGEYHCPEGKYIKSVFFNNPYGSCDVYDFLATE